MIAGTDGGTLFPIGAWPLDGATSPGDAVSPTEPVRVLICDDEPQLRELVQTCWRAEAGLAVVGEAADGAAGVVYAARLQPDVILLDWHMPRLTGLEALPHLKVVAAHAAVVMWSSNVSATARAAAEAAGVDCFLPKTVALEELTAAVLAAAQRRPAPRATVLLAHPSPSWRAHARVTLDGAGASVHEAGSDREVTEIWRRHRPDVALVARAFVERLRLDELGATEEATPTAMVVVDGDLGVEDALAALDSGVHDHLLVDPLSPPEIVSRVRAAGEVRRLREQLTSTAAHVARLAELAQTDELTGLANRRSLMDQLRHLSSSAQRHGRQFAVALIDIDLFKPINDSHGHRAGDEVLIEVGRRLAARGREEDVVGRLGGDEFLVLLSEADHRGGAAAAEALRDAVAQRPMRIDGRDRTITVSVGWAVWQGEDAEDLLGRADRDLYAAKQAGRDRTAGATPAA